MLALDSLRSTAFNIHTKTPFANLTIQTRNIINYDGDTLSAELKVAHPNAATPLPKWIAFSWMQKSIIVTPTSEAVQEACTAPFSYQQTQKSAVARDATVQKYLYQTCLYSFDIEIKDMYFTTRQTFNIYLYNNQPYPNFEEVLIYRHVVQPLVFDFSAKFIVEIDQEDTHTHVFEDMPEFLSFDQRNMILVGSCNPTFYLLKCPRPYVNELVQINNAIGQQIFKRVVHCPFNMSLVAFDGQIASTLPVALFVYNTAPYLNRPIYSVNMAESPLLLKMQSKTQITLGRTFVDEDNDLLLYRVSQNSSTVEEWIFVHQLKQMIMFNLKISYFIDGCLNNRTEDVSRVNAEGEAVTYKRINCDYKLDVYGTDPFNESAVGQLNIVVQNSQPYPNRCFRLYNNVPNLIMVHINAVKEINIQQDIFVDADTEDTLSFSVLYNDQPTGGPIWIRYLPDVRTLRLMPTGNDLYSLCPEPVVQTVLKVNNSNNVEVDMNQTYCQYNLTLVASDGYFENSMKIKIRVFNNQPIVNLPIYVNATTGDTLSFHVTKKLKFKIGYDKFYDYESPSSLQYSTSALPAGFFFDSYFAIIQAQINDKQYFSKCGVQTETKTVLNELGQSQAVVHQFCLMEIEVIASDGYESASQPLKVKVFNNQPYYNDIFCNGGAPNEIIIDSKERFSTKIAYNSFLDPDADQLILRGELEGHAEIPTWILFDEIEYYLRLESSKKLVLNRLPDVVINPTYQTRLNIKNEAVDIALQKIEYKLAISATDQFIESDGSHFVKIGLTNSIPYTYACIAPGLEVNQTLYNLTSDKHFQINFYPNVFKDSDQDELTYFLTYTEGAAVPGWIELDQDLMQISGKPTKTDLTDDCPSSQHRLADLETVNAEGDAVRYSQQLCEYNFLLQATDELSVVSQKFRIQVINKQPFINQRLSTLYPDLRVHVGRYFELDIPPDVFLDFDLQDQLVFEAVQRGQASLPNWLTFIQQDLTFQGIPQPEDLFELCPQPEEETVQYLSSDNLTYISAIRKICVYDIDVTVTDGLYFSSQALRIKVYNTNPFQERRLAQLLPNGAYLSYHMLDMISYILPKAAFIELDASDQLVYAMHPFEGQIYPKWLKFNPKIRRIFGFPRISDLKENCTSVYQEFVLQYNYLGDPVNVTVDVCTIDLNISASDGLHTLYDSIQLRLRNARPYVYHPVNLVNDEIAPKMLHIGVEFRYTIRPDCFKDIDSRADIEITPNFTRFPKWLSYNKPYKMLQGKPISASDLGSYTVEVIADDQIERASQTFEIIVYNHDPVRRA